MQRTHTSSRPSGETAGLRSPRRCATVGGSSSLCASPPPAGAAWMDRGGLSDPTVGSTAATSRQATSRERHTVARTPPAHHGIEPLAILRLGPPSAGITWSSDSGEPARRAKKRDRLPVGRPGWTQGVSSFSGVRRSGVPLPTRLMYTCGGPFGTSPSQVNANWLPSGERLGSPWYPTKLVSTVAWRGGAGRPRIEEPAAIAAARRTAARRRSRASVADAA